jgi:sucrose-6-phosphate hydrolase SacC (GH32 family)
MQVTKCKINLLSIERKEFLINKVDSKRDFVFAKEQTIKSEIFANNTSLRIFANNIFLSIEKKSE